MSHGRYDRESAAGQRNDALRAKYRKLRAGLNMRLAEAGHLLEPLLAAKRLDAIDFKKAPKGALAKCRKALLKDPETAARWKKAMAASDKAVPDITDIGGALPTLPVVLTAEGRGVPPSQPPALLLAAFVAACSQKLRHVAVDGELIALAGATASLKAHGMRLLLVHRLREAADAAVGRFKPRANLRPMPSRGAEIVDCKTHVSNVIRGLKADLAVGEVRVSFVGYRDWGERNSPHAPRVVVHEFVPLSRVDEVTAAIGREGANGGGDGPEDVIIAIESALRLEWRGDVRVAVFIADAPAHGYSGQGRGGDDFPAGLCPDQRTPLPTLLGRLANEQGVDLLATKLNSYTDIFYNMLAEQYPGGDGFGVLSLTDVAHKFKAAIMGALSEAVLSLIAPSADAAGVQTFDGTTLSSLTATLSASLREPRATQPFIDAMSAAGATLMKRI
ncbi:hypothetical protein EMIHUDRAFT_245379 [Emiliania huxleyi CCMP1516]|uniref:Uncharacterized protein n=2 Tax=Emiliania huxleyi TaxID=2903 RepID=A0A0D3IXV3_EMIH1|nr:hypothetical protein EMIHUDRAFT_245379 [Emiliania huxleyi CCMP1516]EOD16088.1 hypothetical protein EMIHUDRAFT_245379 [Emiliania huxleyi CCMP1516]|eukprot:XP_005768517.1 hypothetical protein EMIHUDRAFT_245379 [Emiliania huxleyi CCMP1516]